MTGVVGEQLGLEMAEVGLDVPVGYKWTEVGVIPEDWKVVQLGDCASYVGSGKTKTKSSGEYPLYGSTGLIGSCERPEYSGESLLVARVGANAGRLNYVCDEYGVSDNTILIKTKPDNSIEFFKYWLVRKNLNTLVFGSGQPLITGTQLKNLSLPLPAKLEQTAIATALSNVDALITELQTLIAKKQAIKTATMQQLLTGRTRLPQFALREDGTPKGYKASELGEIPEDWEVTRLGEIAKFLKGAGLPKSDLIESGQYPCVHYGQLFTTYGYTINQVISRTNSLGIFKSQRNDVLMPTSDVTPNGLATASCLTEHDVILGGDILVIRSINNTLDGSFFAYLVTVMRDQVMQLVTGSTVYHLYGGDMAKFRFAKPAISEQTAIAAILSDMDSDISNLQQRLSKARQIKQGMMQQLLTGQIRLI